MSGMVGTFHMEETFQRTDVILFVTHSSRSSTCRLESSEMTKKHTTKWNKCDGKLPVTQNLYMWSTELQDD